MKLSRSRKERSRGPIKQQRSRVPYPGWFAASGVLLVFFAFSAISADELLLRNGSRLSGTIVNQSRTHIYIQIGERKRKIPKSQIRRIQYSSSPSPGGALPDQRIKTTTEKVTGSKPEQNTAKKKQNQTSRDDLRERAQKKRFHEQSGKERRLWALMHRDLNHLSVGKAIEPSESEQSSISAIEEAEMMDSISQKSGFWWRSLLVPGWGQIHGGRTIRGALSGSFTLLAAGLSGHYYGLAKNSKDTYNTRVGWSPVILPVLASSAGSATGISGGLGEVFLYRYTGGILAQGARSDYQQHTESHQAAAAVAVLVYLVQLGDALFFMDSSERDGSPVEADLSWNLGPAVHTTTHRGQTEEPVLEFMIQARF